MRGAALPCSKVLHPTLNHPSYREWECFTLGSVFMSYSWSELCLCICLPASTWLDAGMVDHPGGLRYNSSVCRNQNHIFRFWGCRIETEPAVWKCPHSSWGCTRAQQRPHLRLHMHQSNPFKRHPNLQTTPPCSVQTKSTKQFVFPRRHTEQIFSSAPSGSEQTRLNPVRSGSVRSGPMVWGWGWFGLIHHSVSWLSLFLQTLM